MPIFTFGQNQIEVENLVEKGIESHDKGDFKDAISKYNEALELDKNNLLALSEKALTLNAMKAYAEAVEISQLAIKTHKNDNLQTVYVAYANSLDHLNQPENAIKIYDEGLKIYPDYHQLHFNKGITQVNSKKYDGALLSFQKATKSNPNHSSSFNAIGILEMDNNRIPSILALSRFLIIENQSSRAKSSFGILKSLLSKGVKQKEDISISVNIDPKTLSKSEQGSKLENNFSSTDMILSIAATQDYDDQNKNKTEAEKFISKFETICSSLHELKKDNHGYYWDYLASYFIELKNKNLVEPFVYVLFTISGSEDVMQWQKTNSALIQKFNDWSKSYTWK